jgi:tRNA-modifying protein YgfZ
MDATTVATQMNMPSFQPQILTNRAVIRVGGDGALAFLHNLLTMELSDPKPHYGALLTPQGKILHDVFVVPDGDHVWIDVAKVQAADLLRRLMMYRLRAKLDIALDDGKAVAVSSSADLHGIAFVDPRVPGIGYRTIVDAGMYAAGTGYHAARIALGLADSEQDIGSGLMFVHEANLDQLHGVSFTKGCYVGQEVVSRTHHRHTARNRILPVRFEAQVLHGADIVSGEMRLGTMLSSVDGHGLALLRLDRLAEAASPILTNGVKLSVHKPAWAKFEVVIPQ